MLFTHVNVNGLMIFIVHHDSLNVFHSYLLYEFFGVFNEKDVQIRHDYDTIFEVAFEFVLRIYLQTCLCIFRIATYFKDILQYFILVLTFFYSHESVIPMSPQMVILWHVATLVEVTRISIPLAIVVNAFKMLLGTSTNVISYS